ncbi:hypothetical protein [Pseudorhodoferax sp.]|uniref:hypothetical protein n=1 Tax=Pseudorhodoferax sp. TaxID=1993553 RepID=UPI0039E250B6
MRQLIFVHGRSQQDKDGAVLKKQWIEAWEKGLQANGLRNPLSEGDIRFPYYGNTLIDMLGGKSSDEAAEVIVKGPAPAAAEQAVMREMIAEIAAHEGVAEMDIRAQLSEDVIEMGPANWGWVQGILTALDGIRPLSKAIVSLVTADVAKYLTHPDTRKKIDDGVRSAIQPGEDAVIVSHSLGTVVAYSVLTSRTGAFPDTKVPLFVTLGSPLAVNAVRSRLRPHGFPPMVGSWYNAMDPDDVVALYPLIPKHFNTGKSIDNHERVDNWTDNQHGIVGYLDDKEVAKRIYDALTAP